MGRVASVAPHPNSDKLYICKIDVGDGRERQVVAGLQQYITIDELQVRRTAGAGCCIVLWDCRARAGARLCRLALCRGGLIALGGRAVAAWAGKSVLKMHAPSLGGPQKSSAVEPLTAQGSLVAVVLNLKAAKLAGEASEAMILAGSVKVGGG